MSKSKPFGIDKSTKFSALQIQEIEGPFALLKNAPEPDRLFGKYIAGTQDDDIDPNQQVDFVLAGTNESVAEMQKFGNSLYGKSHATPEGYLVWNDNMPKGIAYAVAIKDVRDPFLGKHMFAIMFDS